VAYDDTETEAPSTSRYSDDELLRYVGEERKRSVGFGESGDSGELTAARQKALNYAKGVMDDVVAAENRSAVVDTAVADAIETVLPDIMEVFVGGDDIASFMPMGEHDEAAAQEESDYVRHVVMEENPGFLILYTAFKDALLTRTGIFHWWAEDEDRSETKAKASAEQAPMLQAVAEQLGQPLEAEEQDDGSVALVSRSKRLKVCVRAFPSEDFGVAPDTVNLPDATYCVVRDRPRVQDLIARGIDAEKARDLPSYALRNDAVEHARDKAGESQQTADDPHGDLRTVEIRCHYIRLADDDGDLAIWRVVTDAEETTLLEKEQVDHIPFAAVTPYMTPHRFYGESVADKLIEVQKINTTLLRMLLDSGYFALNQRMTVDINKATEFTISDLLANQPGHPIRVQGDGAVLPVSAGALNFGVLDAMEYVATIAERRSGIVRNAQGLNPDTLHDTAQGAMTLIMAAQKRVRLICRIFAETGVKDLFLGVHRMLRTSYTEEHAPASAKLRDSWKQVQPGDWGERNAMSVHVGVGSAGKEHDLMVAGQRLQMQQQAAMLPGAMGTLIDKPNIHQAFMAWERAAGSKNPDQYWTDPASPPAQQAAQQQAQQPNPEMAKAQADMQLRQAQAQGDMQLAHAKAQSDVQLQALKHQGQMQADAEQAQRDHELSMAKLQAELQLKRYQVDQELQLKRESLAAELQLKRELGFAQARSAHEVGMAKASTSVQDVEPGGEPG
jgi:plasmid stability protein